MSRLDELESRFEKVTSQFSEVKASRDFLKKQESEYTQEIKDLREDSAVLDKVEELFKYLLNQYVYKYAESFSEVVTEGLQSIFYDQDISFNINVIQKYGKVHVEFETIKDGHRGQALESFGGGVSSVQSLLLRLLVLLKTDLANYLILDESLAALSSEYTENCGNFIKKMCSELGVDVLLITHNKDFLEYSDRSYQAKLDSDGKLVIDKLK